MDSIETTSTLPTNTRSVFSCPSSPNFLYDLNGATFSWILIGIKAIASPATIVLNISVITVLTRRRELRKRSNTLLSSLAVAGLLMGAFNMPLSAVVYFLIVRQFWLEHICMLEILNVYSMYCFSMCSLYHLTAIAWERYAAVVKWMDYKVIATKGRIKKLAIAAWLLAKSTTVPVLVMEMIGLDVKIKQIFYHVWCVCGVVAFILIIYFYFRAYLGVRKRKISEIMAKIQSKIAKTGAILSGALVLSLLPAIVMYTLGWVFPVLHTSTSFLSWELLIQLNSLVNPILYCYRDRQFRNTVLELLRMTKRRATQPTVGSLRYIRRKGPFGSVDLELHDLVKPPRSGRAASCDLAMIPVPDYETGSHEAALRRSMSAPKLKEYRSLSSHGGFQPQQPSSSFFYKCNNPC